MWACGSVHLDESFWPIERSAGSIALDGPSPGVASFENSNTSWSVLPTRPLAIPYNELILVVKVACRVLRTAY